MDHGKFWQEFFHLYRELPALWRVKSTEYSDRVLKSNCYLKLINKLREVYPDADREMVVRKINNFRTSYRKELKRKRESQQYGREYKPTLWYFDCLSFLDDQDDQCAGERSSFNEEENTEEKKHTTQNFPLNPSAPQLLASKRYHINTNKESDEEENLPSSSKRKKIMIHKIQPIPAVKPYVDHKQAQIDADILAKSWAVQYKEMQGNQKLIVRKIISDILFHGCLGTLDMSATIDIQEILQRNSNSQNHMPSQSPMDSNASYRFGDRECFNYESVRESPLPFNSSSRSVSPTNVNAGSEIDINEIKFEVP